MLKTVVHNKLEKITISPPLQKNKKKAMHSSRHMADAGDRQDFYCYTFLFRVLLAKGSAQLCKG